MNDTAPVRVWRFNHRSNARYLMQRANGDGTFDEGELECEVMMVHDDDEGPPEAVSDSESDDEEPGLCIVDSACRKTMHGRTWRRHFVAELDNRGLSYIQKPSSQRFLGVGGSTKALSSDTFPIGIAGVNGEIESCCVPSLKHMLLSLPDQKRLGFHLHTVIETCDIDLRGVTDLKLRTTKKGHLAISLLDFEGGVHGGLSMHDNDEAAHQADLDTNKSFYKALHEEEAKGN